LQRDGHNRYFIVGSLLPMHLVSAKRLFSKNKNFFGNVKNRFAPQNTSKWRATYLKICAAVFRIRRCLHWLSSAVVLNLFCLIYPLIKSKIWFYPQQRLVCQVIHPTLG